MTPTQKLAMSHMAASAVILRATNEEELVEVLSQEEDQGKAPASFFIEVGNILDTTYSKPEFKTIITKWVDDNEGTFAPEDEDILNSPAT